MKQSEIVATVLISAVCLFAGGFYFRNKLSGDIAETPYLPPTHHEEIAKVDSVATNTLKESEAAIEQLKKVGFDTSKLTSSTNLSRFKIKSDDGVSLVYVKAEGIHGPNTSQITDNVNPPDDIVISNIETVITNVRVDDGGDNPPRFLDCYVRCKISGTGFDDDKTQLYWVLYGFKRLASDEPAVYFFKEISKGGKKKTKKRSRQSKHRRTRK